MVNVGYQPFTNQSQTQGTRTQLRIFPALIYLNYKHYFLRSNLHKYIYNIQLSDNGSMYRLFFFSGRRRWPKKRLHDLFVLLLNVPLRPEWISSVTGRIFIFSFDSQAPAGKATCVCVFWLTWWWWSFEIILKTGEKSGVRVLNQATQYHSRSLGGSGGRCGPQSPSSWSGRASGWCLKTATVILKLKLLIDESKCCR